MDDVTIPGWVVWIIIGGVLPWLIKLTVDGYKNKQDIAVNTANDIKHADELKNIYTQIEKSEGRLQESFKRLESRVDTFLANEMGILKQALKKDG